MSEREDYISLRDRLRAERGRVQVAEPVGDPHPQAVLSGAPERKESIVAKALAFISTVSGPKCDDATFDRRMAICDECPSMRVDNEKKYCAACGCGKWRLAELSTKLRYARLKCPRGLFGSVGGGEDVESNQ